MLDIYILRLIHSHLHRLRHLHAKMLTSENTSPHTHTFITAYTILCQPKRGWVSEILIMLCTPYNLTRFTERSDRGDKRSISHVRASALRIKEGEENAPFFSFLTFFTFTFLTFFSFPFPFGPSPIIGVPPTVPLGIVTFVTSANLFIRVKEVRIHCITSIAESIITKHVEVREIN